MKTMKQHGFTLLELLVVIVIIGALAGIGAPNFMKQLSKPRDAERVTAVDTAAKMVKVAAANSFQIDIYGFQGWKKEPGSSTETSDCATNPQTLECIFKENDYTIPQPKKAYCYYYGYNQDSTGTTGTEFFVAAALENTSKTTNKKFHAAGSSGGVAAIEAALGATTSPTNIGPSGSGCQMTVSDITHDSKTYKVYNLSSSSGTCGSFCTTP